MQMPLCLPEKITSGPAAIGVIGATPECTGANGVAKAGGMTPAKKGNRKYTCNLLEFYKMLWFMSPSIHPS